MVQITLRLDAVPKPDHAADALAAALCHYYSRRSLRRFQEREKR
ncbi:MAG: crossover junction endodeoxyribonuclease RuvC [Thermacetogeniaceae bacterium]